MDNYSASKKTGPLQVMSHNFISYVTFGNNIWYR